MLSLLMPFLSLKFSFTPYATHPSEAAKKRCPVPEMRNTGGMAPNNGCNPDQYVASTIGELTSHLMKSRIQISHPLPFPSNCDQMYSSYVPNIKSISLIHHVFYDVSSFQNHNSDFQAEADTSHGFLKLEVISLPLKSQNTLPGYIASSSLHCGDVVHMFT